MQIFGNGITPTKNIRTIDTIAGYLQVNSKTKEVSCVAKKYFSEIDNCNNKHNSLGHTISALIYIRINSKGNEIEALQ